MISKNTYIYVVNCEENRDGIEGIYTDPDVAIDEAKKIILDQNDTGYKGETSDTADGTSLMAVYKVKIDQQFETGMLLQDCIWESNDMKTK